MNLNEDSVNAVTELKESINLRFEKENKSQFWPNEYYELMNEANAIFVDILKQMEKELGKKLHKISLFSLISFASI